MLWPTCDCCWRGVVKHLWCILHVWLQESKKVLLICGAHGMSVLPGFRCMFTHVFKAVRGSCQCIHHAYALGPALIWSSELEPCVNAKFYSKACCATLQTRSMQTRSMQHCRQNSSKKLSDMLACRSAEMEGSHVPRVHPDQAHHRCVQSQVFPDLYYGLLCCNPIPTHPCAPDQPQ